MDKTEHFGLNMPGGNDYAEVENLNENARKVDDALWEQKQQSDNAGKALEEHTQDTTSHLTDGAQTINGVKTFAESPVVPEPTMDGHTANKKYVDGAKISVDSTFSLSSENPVQNKVVTKAIEDHKKDSNNPHHVTPEKIGAYTKLQVDDLLANTGNAKIATGSYYGTGTNGGSHKNTLHFPFIPRFVIIYMANTTFSVNFNSGVIRDLYVWMDGTTQVRNYNQQTTYFTLSGTTLSWYYSYSDPDKGSSIQLNSDGVLYRYIAIGG